MKNDDVNIGETNLNKAYKYENLIVTQHNHFAHAASLAIAECPGEIYNPFYIYGATGVGKTYMLHAIGNYVVENYPEKKMYYTTGQMIVEEIIETIKKRDVNIKELRNKYSAIDVLLVDDIQFMMGKEFTQMEFLNVVKGMCECGKQIVVSCDRPLNYQDALHDKMQSFFSSGLVEEITLPDPEARMAFLLSCLEKQQGEDILSMEIVEYVSQNMEVNYNVLNGVLQKLIARSKDSDKPINILTVKEIINNITMQMSEAGGNSEAYVPDTVVIARILKIVARYYELAPDDLIGDERKKAILVPRFVAMYLMYEIKQLSLIEICRKMNRNFENILYGVETIKQEITKNSELRESIVQLEQIIGKNGWSL